MDPELISGADGGCWRLRTPGYSLVFPGCLPAWSILGCFADCKLHDTASSGVGDPGENLPCLNAPCNFCCSLKAPRACPSSPSPMHTTYLDLRSQCGLRKGPHSKSFPPCELPVPHLWPRRKQSLRAMAEKIMLIRAKLKEKLRILGTPGSWEHITTQLGTHSFMGLLRKCLARGFLCTELASPSLGQSCLHAGAAAL